MAFHWSLSESNCSQVSGILCIQTDLNNAVVWMVLGRPPISNPFRPLTNVALCGWAAKADDSIVCFGAKPDKGFLDMKSRRIRKWEGDSREAVGGWTAERQLAAGQQRGEQQRLAWIHGQGQSRPDTGAERRGSMG